ncbi:flavin reductase family protein [Nocardia nova]|uniref:flavin reductase family protein n=1 Tax=Nocardia nova TaxID=37330 RepID=UPI000CEA6CFF|nr:oxidoreductase [Nocardia nova]
MSDLSEIPSDSAGLRRAFAHFPSGVVAVCAEFDGVPAGLVVSTFVPVSLDPPLVSFCVQNSSTTWPKLVGAQRLGLSLLSAHQDEAAQRMSSRNGDRFGDVEVHRGEGGSLFVGGAAAWLEGTVHTQVSAGDHQVVLVQITRLATRSQHEPLVFHGSRFRRLHPGADPASAEVA